LEPVMAAVPPRIFSMPVEKRVQTRWVRAISTSEK
jgi:hypothetical protein